MLSGQKLCLFKSVSNLKHSTESFGLKPQREASLSCVRKAAHLKKERAESRYRNAYRPTANCCCKTVINLDHRHYQRFESVGTRCVGQTLSVAMKVHCHLFSLVSHETQEAYVSNFQKEKREQATECLS